MPNPNIDPDASKAPTPEHVAAKLGPTSLELIRQPQVARAVAERMQGGASPADAVLAEVHCRVGSDRALLGEFLSSFVPELLRYGTREINQSIRRVTDQADLVQSILADVLPDVANIEFQSRAAFVAFLRRRTRWKAGTKRRGARKLPQVSEPMPEPQNPGPSPPSVVIREDEHREIALRILRLPPREREMLQRHLRGESTTTISEQLGMSPRTARRCLAEARKLVREGME